MLQNLTERKLVVVTGTLIHNWHVRKFVARESSSLLARASGFELLDTTFVKLYHRNRKFCSPLMFAQRMRLTLFLIVLLVVVALPALYFSISYVRREGLDGASNEAKVRQLVMTHLAFYRRHANLLVVPKDSFYVELVNGKISVNYTNLRLGYLPTVMHRVDILQEVISRAIKFYGPLPDTIFRAELDDEPSLARFELRGNYYLAPIFAYSRYYGSNHLFIPDVYADSLSSQSKNLLDFPFHARKPLCGWRGSTTGRQNSLKNIYTLPRLKLVNLSLKHPDILDAKFAQCVQCERNVSELLIDLVGPYAAHFEYRDTFAYKYLVDMDGNGWSSRFRKLISTGAIVVKQRSPYEEFWSNLGDDVVIYVMRDLSDLIEKLNAIRLWSEDKYLAEVSKTLQFWETYFTEKQLLLYLHTLLTEYAKLNPFLL